MVRRAFSLSQISDSWNINDEEVLKYIEELRQDRSYSHMLSNVTVYTSLESCSQCSGIMALARIRDVVYLQDDVGMNRIGNIIHNLTKNTALRAPRPISAAEFNFPYYERLNQAFERFRQRINQGETFYISSGGQAQRSASITTFLCSDDAYEVYQEANQAFVNLKSNQLLHPDYKPPKEKKALTNAKVLAHAHNFLKYAVKDGQRGTPHR
ncbi:MAG: hypothetical protein HC880_13795 [Bacteroidia bacterium]|nr:hypothetical protein [Bacteroidia bacterium]